MNYTLILEAEKANNTNLHTDIEFFGTYEITLFDENKEDLGSKCISAFMDYSPISFPENFSFYVIDSNGNYHDDLGISHAGIKAEITKLS